MMLLGCITDRRRTGALMDSWIFNLVVTLLVIIASAFFYHHQFSLMSAHFCSLPGRNC